jgi:calcium-dependent protein kinase
MKICHRDIKPENILFSETGKPVLADFGFARYITSVNGLSTLGTPLFLAPEINDGTYDSKCDVWSLGISLYYALTGLLPFKGEFLDELMRNIKLAPIAWDKLGDQESNFLKIMLERNYKNRASADELLQHEWLTGHKTAIEM